MALTSGTDGMPFLSPEPPNHFGDGPLGRIAAPTLLVWGDRDGLLPPQEQQRLAAAIPGARSQVYPETGHSPHWEHPERFAADLDAFTRAG